MAEKVFISYKSASPDMDLAQALYDAFAAEGLETFYAKTSIDVGDVWHRSVQDALKASDYFVVLLSTQSMQSDMVTEEVRLARELRSRSQDNRPLILPVRVQLPFSENVNYDLAGYLNRIQQATWDSEADTPRLIAQLLARIHEGNARSLDDHLDEPASGESENPEMPVSMSQDVPVPNAPLEIPGGQLALDSPWYVERRQDELCRNALTRAGALVRIRAPRQYGKTSLLSRLIAQAAENGEKVISLSFQLFEEATLQELEPLLRYLCTQASRKLRLPRKLDEVWADPDLGAKDKCTIYFEDHILDAVDVPVVLAIDEADRLFEFEDVCEEFFSMLRFWHEDGKINPRWRKLKIVIAHGNDTQYAIRNPNQSPFNVGYGARLEPFTREQATRLARQHGLRPSPEALEALLSLVGGHPFLVRKALYALAQNGGDVPAFVEAALQDDGPFQDHLKRYLWMLYDDPVAQNVLREVYRTGTTGDFRTADGLVASGLLRGNHPQYEPSCRLYAEFFANKL